MSDWPTRGVHRCGRLQGRDEDGEWPDERFCSKPAARWLHIRDHQDLGPLLPENVAGYCESCFPGPGQPKAAGLENLVVKELTWEEVVVLTVLES